MSFTSRTAAVAPSAPSSDSLPALIPRPVSQAVTLGKAKKKPHFTAEGLTLLARRENPGVTVTDLVDMIRDGIIDGMSLPAELRRRCVEELSDRGQTAEQIGAALHCDERTVRRHRAETRKLEPLTPSPTLAGELLGEFQRLTLASIQRLTALCNNALIPVPARLEAERAILRHHQQLIELADKHKMLEGAKEKAEQLT